MTSSVLQFQYNGYCINILDTPGHQDFSEDTYRTLMAADSAVMVIDGAKGVEAQTRKLFKVCVMRDIPIFTFINKMDREARDPFELCEEIEKELGIETYPVNWPIGSGKEFLGVYDRNKGEILHFSSNTNAKKSAATQIDLTTPSWPTCWARPGGTSSLRTSSCWTGPPAPSTWTGCATGSSPVFFGSALTTCGVEPFLEDFLRMTTPPPRHSSGGDHHAGRLLLRLRL